MIPQLSLLRRALFLVAVASFVVGTAACQPDTSPSTGPVNNTAEEKQLLTLMNNFRAANGLAQLVPAGDGTAKAQEHSATMAAYLSMFHSTSMTAGIVNDWTALGENVGVGYSVQQIESMFESSAPHRANLLNGAYNQIGVGVSHGSDGRVYLTQFFIGR